MFEYLQRGDAPFGEEVWQKIDDVVVMAARSRLSVRRILTTEGPFGVDLKNLPARDEVVGGAGGVNLIASRPTPVTALSADFNLAKRDIAAFEAHRIDIDLRGAALAALALAEQEDRLLLYGSEELGVTGLTNTEGVSSVGLDDWSTVGTAVENIIRAATTLDDAGIPGPYALALAPDRFNLLFRLYPDANLTEMEHARQIVTEGIVKSPVLGAGGLLVAVGPQYASIVLGQDLHAGFVGPASDLQYQFNLSESLALRIRVPGAICVIE